ncbi:(deoxy)nucleoside triphosphate pyrophosphohydrolase [Sphingomonas sp. NIBR02145]|uniref:(deoxy)nucleoside triphosphate pyrophosphohydrolase n=1 Tax=Sphingomonas sp. NIBR02145 TaxID=3014784 RepID=UPI0022B58C59|nr:(deoxy)nucleoside triphosphate pyrophosphohydrolase [Sphingomonas sp. NIBR02145]WHU03153.1 (deoxy)nucleoside triphosphate pyrophosphohydrolase [Sphingomonas sp. NIBR02145]
MDASDMLLVVAAALIDDCGRVLLQQRPPGKPMAGLWEFPGGKIEPGESPESALARELHEELGLTLSVKDLRPIAFASEPLAGRHLLLLLYVARTWQGEPVAHHATELRWVTPAEMRGMPMPPADVPLVEALVGVG